jgi:hypothetical protein
MSNVLAVMSKGRLDVLVHTLSRRFTYLSIQNVKMHRLMTLHVSGTSGP